MHLVEELHLVRIATDAHAVSTRWDELCQMMMKDASPERKMIRVGSSMPLADSFKDSREDILRSKDAWILVRTIVVGVSYCSYLKRDDRGRLLFLSFSNGSFSGFLDEC